MVTKAVGSGPSVGGVDLEGAGMESGEREGEVGGPSPGRMESGAGELLYMQEVT